MRVNVPAVLLRCMQETGCVVPEEGVGPHIVTVSGLRIRLHRYLWVSQGRELGFHEYLLQNCQTKGCVRPDHFERSSKPYRTMRGCRNGHTYSEVDVQPDGSRVCHICAEDRRQRKAERARRGGDPNWAIEKRRKFCKHGHEFNPENTYRYQTPSGGVRRKCRTCTIARRRGIDPSDVVAA